MVKTFWVKNLLLPIVVFSTIFSFLVVPTVVSPAKAADSANFDPGNIISDSNFYSRNAMTAVEIQTFLNSQVRNCQNSNCLKDYRQDTADLSLTFGTCRSYKGARNESAATIIFKVQEACNVSAKVILTILQKEQSLVTRSAPTDSQMRSAMGNACPDTGPCDPAYSGFFMQVFSGARQLAWYGNPNGPFRWITVGANRNILYNPDASCGSKNVFIRNKATAALYYYTPYQPNAAALRNLYGTGDSCSAYGNRNFWRIYSDWFGSPTGNSNFSLDVVSAEWKGIRVAGWAKHSTDTSSQYLWVNINGTGGPIYANKHLNWFNSLFPGFGNNHGYDEVIPVQPGSHQVCVHFLESIECRYVTVLQGKGSLDSVNPTRGGVNISGWSLDANSNGASFIWVNVNGSGGPYLTNKRLDWLPALHSGVSPDQGFDLFVPTRPGQNSICVFGAGGIELGCRTVSVPFGTGALDSVSVTPSGANIKGWYVDFTRTDKSFIWVDINGAGSHYVTNTSLNWLEAYLPGAGSNHGFDFTIPLDRGTHRICVTGTVLLGCRTLNINSSFQASLDEIKLEGKSINVSGWSVRSKSKTETTFLWVTINGKGQHIAADKYLNWIDSHIPGSGPNHGFNHSFSVNSGLNRVCVYTDILLGCRDFRVP
jgi:hypothetical protein